MRHLYRRQRRWQQKDEITSVRALFIDEDGTKRSPETWHASPDFVVRRDETHWHAYWRVADLGTAEFREAQRRLIAHYGTDITVHDLPRVLRLAGTLHLKDRENPRQMTVEGRIAAGREWARTKTELLAGLPEISTRSEAGGEASDGSGDIRDVVSALSVIPNPGLHWSE